METIQFNLPLRRQIRNMGRFAHIVNVFARHGYWSFIERMEMRKVLNESELEEAQSSHQAIGASYANNDKPDSLPTRLRRCFEELGPAFVKLGQVLASREDLLSSEFTSELRKLHSKVETLPYEIIRKRLVDELGAEKMSQFKEIDPKPLAAGSIAQVHKATLLNGDSVVIKIQRPGIRAQIETDLDLMDTMAQLLERYISEIRFIRPTAMVAALSDALRSELDFVREAGSMAKMASNFRDVPHVHFPNVYWELSNQKILTLSHLAGVTADDKDSMVTQGIDIKLLMSRGIAMFMKMVFVDGYFHGDLHPGNILAQPDSHIGLLDFGLVIRISARTREHLAGLLLCLAREDFDGMVNHYLDLADTSTAVDVTRFQHDVSNTITPYMGLSLKQTRSGALLWDLARIAAKHQAPFPQDLIVFVKTMATFEGVGSRLDPDFNIMTHVEDFAGDIVAELYSPKRFQEQALSLARDVASLMRHAPQQTKKLLSAALDGQLKLTVSSTELLRLSKSVDRTGSRLSVAIIVGALLIGSSILTYSTGMQHPNTHIIGPAGFVLAGLLAFYIVVSILRSGRL